MTRIRCFHVGYLPSGQTGSSAQLRETIINIDDAHRTLAALDQSHHDRFVFQRIERTGGVHQSPANLKEFQSLEGDGDLQRVQGQRSAEGPFLPQFGGFALGLIQSQLGYESTIAAARNIT